MAKTGRGAGGQGNRASTRIITRTEERVDDPGEREDEVPVGPEPEEQADPLDSAITEITGRVGLQVNIYKLDPRDSKSRSWCCDLDEGEDDGYDTASLMKRLQAEFNGGRFELVARDKGVIVRRAQFSVMPPQEKPAQQMAAVDDKIAASIKAALDPVMQIILQTRQPAFSLDTLVEKAVKLGPVLAVLKDLLGSRAPQGGDNMSELDRYLQMKQKLDLLGLGDSEPSAVTQILAAAKEFGFGDMLTQLKQRQSAPQPRTVARPSVVAEMPLRPATPADPATALLMQLKSYLPALKQMAESGVSASDAGARIASLLPDTLIDVVCDAIEGGTFLPLIQSDPQFAQHQTWLAEVAQAILDNCTEEPEGGAVEGGENTGE